MKTRYWDMPGFNSCALVVHAILKRAGCEWAKYTADAKAIYDMAYGAGWRPSAAQEAGCIVAWNSKSEGSRSRIGDRQKQTRRGTTRYRHVGIATGALLSVDNTSWLSRPTAFFTFRPITYERPIFLCHPGEAKPGLNRHSREEVAGTARTWLIASCFAKGGEGPPFCWRSCSRGNFGEAMVRACERNRTAPRNPWLLPGVVST